MSSIPTREFEQALIRRAVGPGIAAGGLLLPFYGGNAGSRSLDLANDARLSFHHSHRGKIEGAIALNASALGAKTIPLSFQASFHASRQRQINAAIEPRSYGKFFPILDQSTAWPNLT